MGNTMPRSPDGSRSMVLGQEGGLQFEKLKERQAHQHDALQVRWQSGIHTKVPVCQRLSVSMLFLIANWLWVSIDSSGNSCYRPGSFGSNPLRHTT
jgi:hypothetical protein